jgi:hypothetical protein
MKRLAGIVGVLILVALLPIKDGLARVGLIPEFLAVFFGAALVITLISYAVLGKEKQF